MTSAGQGHRVVVAATLLHEVNRNIREMAADFSASSAEDLPQEYLCECGCGHSVSLSESEFDGRVAAERPITAQGHVIARAHAARELARGLRQEAAALRAEAGQRKRRIRNRFPSENLKSHTG